MQDEQSPGLGKAPSVPRGTKTHSQQCCYHNKEKSDAHLNFSQLIFPALFFPPTHSLLALSAQTRGCTFSPISSQLLEPLPGQNITLQERSLSEKPVTTLFQACGSSPVFCLVHHKQSRETGSSSSSAVGANTSSSGIVAKISASQLSWVRLPDGNVCCRAESVWSKSHKRKHWKWSRSAHVPCCSPKSATSQGPQAPNPTTSLPTEPLSQAHRWLPTLPVFQKKHVSKDTKAAALAPQLLNKHPQRHWSSGAWQGKSERGKVLWKCIELFLYLFLTMQNVIETTELAKKLKYCLYDKKCTKAFFPVGLL